MNTNLQHRIEKVSEIVEKYYEPGNQRRSKIQALRNEVMKIYPMSERTFWRYMAAAAKTRRKREATLNETEDNLLLNSY